MAQNKQKKNNKENIIKNKTCMSMPNEKKKKSNEMKTEKMNMNFRVDEIKR